MLLRLSAVLAASAVLLAGGSRLVWGDPPAEVNVRTWRGVVGGKTIPIVTPSERIAVLFVDSLAAEAIPVAFTELEQLYRAGGKQSLRLLAVTGAGHKTYGPFRSIEGVRAAFAELRKLNGSAPMSDPPRFYDELLNQIPSFGTNWTTAIVVGNFPVARQDIQNYAEARLTSAAIDAQVRLNFINPADRVPDWLVRVTQRTLGTGPPEGVTSAYLLTWSDPVPPRGFHVYSTASNEAAIAKIPALGALPSIAQFQLLRDHVQQAVSATEMTALKSHLDAALAINPGDHDALRLRAVASARAGDWAAAAECLSLQLTYEPDNAEARGRLGHAYFSLGDHGAAELALLKALELKHSTARLHEELGRIYAGRADHTKALSHLKASLEIEPRNQPLWFLHARTATATNEPGLAIASLESGIALGGVTLPERTLLIELSLKAKQKESALKHLRAVADVLPADVEVRLTWARGFDQVDAHKDSLAAWHRVLQVDNARPEAWIRIAAIHLSEKQADQALESLEAGIAAVPTRMSELRARDK